VLLVPTASGSDRPQSACGEVFTQSGVELVEDTVHRARGWLDTGVAAAEPASAARPWAARHSATILASTGGKRRCASFG
jgi:hypothetical protein